jgi:hypothetical protein
VHREQERHRKARIDHEPAAAVLLAVRIRDGPVLMARYQG